MLYLIHGKNSSQARDKLHELLDVLKGKRPDAEMFRVVSEDFSLDKLTELIGGQGLFERKNIVVLDTILPDGVAAEILIDKLDELGESENVFVSIEGKVDAKTLGGFEKYSTKIWKCNEEELVEKKDFNVFALTDAFGRRDRKSLWALYQRALMKGSLPEEIHGLIFWQVKSMLLAAKSQSATAAGLKPFVWGKARGFLKNFKENELEDISAELVDIYHGARRGGSELEVALERLMLGV